MMLPQDEHGLCCLLLYSVGRGSLPTSHKVMAGINHDACLSSFHVFVPQEPSITCSQRFQVDYIPKQFPGSSH